MATLLHVDAAIDPLPPGGTIVESVKRLRSPKGHGFAVYRTRDNGFVITERFRVSDAKENKQASDLAGIPLFGEAAVVSSQEWSEADTLVLTGDEIRLSRLVYAGTAFDSGSPKVAILQLSAIRFGARYSATLTAYSVPDGNEPSRVLSRTKLSFEDYNHLIAYIADEMEPVDSGSKVSVGTFLSMPTDLQIYVADEVQRTYTAGDFLALCDGDPQRAFDIYWLCEWQRPEDVIAEAAAEDEKNPNTSLDLREQVNLFTPSFAP